MKPEYVWIVLSSEVGSPYSDFEAVFTTRELAEQYCVERNDEDSIYIYTVQSADLRNK